MTKRSFLGTNEPKILIGMIIFLSAVFIAWNGYRFGQYLHGILN
ncbi:MAG: hypothetical protein QM724_08430 [Flavobacteriales bacterium]